MADQVSRCREKHLLNFYYLCLLGAAIGVDAFE